MSVKIRLARRGRKKMAIYDVVVADARAPRDGRFIEKIGTYNPNTDPASININNERALKWLLNGAQPTDTVKAMLSYRGVMLKKHLQVGVLKGAITQEQADAKFEAWLNEKEAKIAGKAESIQKTKQDLRDKALAAEAAKNQARLDAIKAREEEAQAAIAAEEAAAAAEAGDVEAPVEEAPAEKAEATETTEEKVEETPAEEPVKDEAPVAEAEEAKAEEPAAEETPAEEPAKEEAPKASSEDEDKAKA
ncbi:30S ribosomal protein S16 [Algoriphagus sediminis]|uniref:Small ribosomal subunit protein bS16 n=1 Tax=Algoriphagus sediminis TaxID=3057113 RepID=A0ABT7YEM3_9BACT|nr:30S ribosomal protein S16 [Algoriphagus sediminis]MDN3204976.1 30S ribosomal protein S16 [Algoriphagus sediminis]